MKYKFLIILFIISNFSLFNIFSLSGIIIPSLESGIYNNNVEVSFNNSLESDIFYYFEESLDKTPVKFLYPLSLTAMSGESRKFTLVVMAIDESEILETITYNYIVDKNIPLEPKLTINDGIYSSELSFKFKDSNDSIYYTIQSQNKSEYRLWNGEQILITQEKGLNTDFIKSYSEDSAGNKSSVVINRFTILPLQKSLQTIDLISPVAGKFLNSQLLYMDTTGYKWIRYTLNNTDPAIRGTSYIDPVLLKSIGDFTLKIAALPFESKEILRKEIDFSIINNKNIVINNDSGVYSEELNLKFNSKELHYNIDDVEVSNLDPFLPDYLSVMPVPGVVKYRIIRVSDNSESGEYRYVYVLDKKIPASPIISIGSESPLVTTTEVRLLSAPGSEIYYTIDGSTPDRYSNYYNKPFKMDLPNGLSSGSMIIKAISYFNDKSTSLVTSKLITFDIKKPEKPIVTKLSEGLRQTLFRIDNVLENRIIYNITYDGSLPPSPNSESFTGKANMTLNIPHGMDQNAIINIALIDRAGNISESVLIDLLKSDTIPPDSPEISYINGEIVIRGTDTLYYKLVSDGKGNNDDFQLYEKPFTIDIDSSGLNNYSIISYSQDAVGNKSKNEIFNDIQIDNRVPIFPEYSGIENKGIYNQPRSMRFHYSDDIKVYYTISTGTTPPSDPILSNENIVNDFIYFDCPVNESRFYSVKMIAAYKENGIRTDPVQINFQIDRIAPRAPLISSIVDGQIYNDDVIISVNENDETTWILLKEQITEKDLNIENFKMNGILLSSNYTLIQSENTEKSYQLAAISIDPAGNTSISRNLISFTIDKKYPESPIIKEEYSTDNNIFIRLLADDMDDIVYEISNDGTYPNIPNKNSSVYNFPIELKAGNSKAVYISARTIDKAGNLSINSCLHKVVFDKISNQVPVIEVGKINSTLSTISFPTITGRKIFLKQGDGDFNEYLSPVDIDLRNNDNLDLFYYSIDTLGNKSSVAVTRLNRMTSSGNIITGISNNKIYNNGRVVWKVNQSRTVRYEVAIDNNEPKNVTVFSPELSDPIVFDSAKGETLQVSLNVKEFNEDVSELEKNDTNYKFTIDKTNPVIPIVLGVENNGYYQKNMLVNFKCEDSVYYKISSDIDGSYSQNFKKYSEDVKISTEEGMFETLKIDMYSEDSAGNRSSVNQVKFIIDKANIYVSVQGHDSNSGSRLKPFKTIKRALEYSDLTKRRIIYLTEGEFLIDNSIIIKDDITLAGGFTLNNWNQGRGETAIAVSKRFPANKPLIEVKSGNVNLSKISLSNLSLDAPIIYMNGGQVQLNNMDLLQENIKASEFVKVINSDLTFNDSKVVFGSIDNGKLFDSKNSTINLLGTTITGNGLSKSLNIFSLDKTKLIIEDSYIIPSIAQKIEIFNSNNSDISIINTNMDTGLGTINTNIFLLTNSKLNMEKSNINSVSSSRILSCFDIKDSIVYLDSLKIYLMGDSGISFILADNSSMELLNSSVVLDKTNEFSYFTKGSNTIINLYKNDISIKSSDIVRGVDLNTSVSIFSNNKIDLEGGTTVFTAFNFANPLNIEFTENSITSKNLSWISSTDQAAITINGGKDSVTINGNNIMGWKSVLNHNGAFVKTTWELNNFRGFLDIPDGNYSK